MASFTKRGKRWTAQVRLNGQSKSKTFDTKIEARNWAHEQEAVIRRHGDLVVGKTLGDAFNKYANEVSPTKKGERWEVVRLNKLARDPIALISLVDLQTRDFEQWRDRALETIKPSSFNRELNIVNAVLETARKKWRWIAVNPVNDLDRPKNPPHRDRRISDDEVERICDGLLFNENEPISTQREYIAFAFLFALETAIRQGELFKLRWHDVRLDEAFMRLTDTKNGTNRDVALSSRARHLLTMLDSDRQGLVIPFNQRSCGQIFRGVVKMVGIDDLTFHDTRHEAITRLARKLDMLDLARMIGHRDPRSLMIYYNATATEIAGRLG